MTQTHQNKGSVRGRARPTRHLRKNLKRLSPIIQNSVTTWQVLEMKWAQNFFWHETVATVA